MVAPTDSVLDFLANDYVMDHPLRPASLRQLKLTVWAIDRWFGGSVPVGELTPDMVNRFLATQAGRLAPKTVNGQRANLLCLWRAAAHRGLVAKPSADDVRRLKEPRRVPRAWRADQLKALMQAAETASGNQGTYPGGIRIGAWWALFVRLTYDTGLRRSDVLALEVDQVRGGRPFEVLQQKTQQAIVRRVRPDTVAALESTIPPSRRLCLPWPYRIEVFYVHWRQHVLGPAGLPSGRTEGPQKLRRTSATHLEAQHPGSAMAHLGHLTPGLAYRNYVDRTLVQAALPLPPAP